MRRSASSSSMATCVLPHTEAKRERLSSDLARAPADDVGHLAGWGRRWRGRPRLSVSRCRFVRHADQSPQLDRRARGYWWPDQLRALAARSASSLVQWNKSTSKRSSHRSPALPRVRSTLRGRVQLPAQLPPLNRARTISRRNRLAPSRCRHRRPGLRRAPPVRAHHFGPTCRSAIETTGAL